MKHPPTTPLGTLLRLSAIVAAAPEAFGPSAAATNDRRSHAPEGLGNGPLDPTTMASTTRGMTNAADGLGGGTGGKYEAMIDGADKDATGHLRAETGAGLDQNMKAESGADFHTAQLSS